MILLTSFTVKLLDHTFNFVFDLLKLEIIHEGKYVSEDLIKKPLLVLSLYCYIIYWAV